MFKPEGAEFPVGSIDVSALSDDEKATLNLSTGQPENAEPEDLSKLLKADLVDRAAAAGVDTEGMTKAELLEALESAEGA